MKNQEISLKKIFQFALIFGFLFIGCKCKKDNEIVPEYQLKGRIFSSCDNPLANAEVVFYQEGNSTLTGKSDSYEQTTTTDAQGNFSLAFKNKLNKPIELRYNHSTILAGIPYGKDVNNIIAYKMASACIQLRLNVLNPHSSSDTLKISNLVSFDDLKIPGPLTSGVLYTATQYAFSEADYNGKSSRITWHFNAYQGVYEKQDFLINKYCSDTIFVTATIN